MKRTRIVMMAAAVLLMGAVTAGCQTSSIGLAGTGAAAAGGISLVTGGNIYQAIGSGLIGGAAGYVIGETLVHNDR